MPPIRRPFQGVLQITWVHARQVFQSIRFGSYAMIDAQYLYAQLHHILNVLLADFGRFLWSALGIDIFTVEFDDGLAMEAIFC